MSNTILPPDPCLLAIILITKTRDGTNYVFHYPPEPGFDRKHARRLSGASAYDSDISTETSSSSDDDHDARPRIHTRTYSRPSTSNDRDGFESMANGSLDESGSTSPDKASIDMWARQTQPKRSNFFGLPDGFHHFLCPAATFDKKRFEMTIDQLVFVGWPVYAKTNGTWGSSNASGTRAGKKGRKQRRPSGTSGTRTSKSHEHQNQQEMNHAAALRRRSVQLDQLAEMSSSGVEDEGNGTSGMETGPEEVAIFEPGYGHYDSSEEAARSKPKKEVLSMFHMAFVLAPLPLEYQRRVDDMYKHVIKKFTKALRYEQVKSDFVLKESEKLRELKTKHSNSPDTILRHSPLARAMADLYLAISASKIAQINLTSRTSFSLQLPLQASISVLPSLTEPQLPGLWLTTANSLASGDDDIDTSGTRLASHFTLLLLQEPSSIIAELTTAQSPLTPYVANFLHHSTPSKSFLQISQNSNIPLSEIQHIASHLIYWRRARAIPPLHIRDVYVTSPNADMKKLKTAAAQYATRFPAVPSLPKMLGRLSLGVPGAYSGIVPSRDHKEIYLDILAWLMRGGWVTQLRSFAWIRVPPEALDRATRKMKEEEEREKQAAAKPKRAMGHRRHGSEDSTDYEDDRSSVASDDPGEPDLPSGYLTPLKSSIHSIITADSASTAKTAIPVKKSDIPTSEPKQPEPKEESRRSVLIIDPKRASGMHSRYLTAIAELIEEELVEEGLEIKSKEVREIWEKCLKYFNGQHALEKIAGREGLKRKKVEALRYRWKSRGFLLEVQHW